MYKVFKFLLIPLVLSSCTTTNIDVGKGNQASFNKKTPSFKNFESDLMLLGAEFVRSYPFNGYGEITDKKFKTRYFEDITTYADEFPSKSQLDDHETFQNLVTDYVERACVKENAIFQKGAGKHGILVNNSTAQITKKDIDELYRKGEYAEAWVLLKNKRKEQAYTNFINHDDFSKKNTSGLKDLICYKYTDVGELKLLHYGRLLLNIRYIDGKLNGRNWGYEYTNEDIGEVYLDALKDVNALVRTDEYYKKPRTHEFSYSSEGILKNLNLYVDSETLSYTIENKTNDTYLSPEFPFDSILSQGSKYSLVFVADSLKKRSDMCHIIDKQLHIYPSGKCSIYVKLSMPYKYALREQEKIYLNSKFGKIELSVLNHKLEYLKEYLLPK